MQIAGKMQVDVLHGQHLGVAAARRAALDAKYGALRGLAQRQHGVFAVAAHAVRQRNADSGFALARRGWRNGRDQNQPRARIHDALVAHVAEPGSRRFCIWVSTAYSAAMTAAWVRNLVFLDMVFLQNRNWGQRKTVPNKK